MHAEAMLLVDDGERQIVERDIVLKQRVGADDEVDVAGSERGQDILALTATLAPGENSEPDTGGSGKPRNGGMMLACQDLRRRHQGGLPARLDHGGCSEQRDDGLAGADIAMQQSQHALRLRQVGDDVGDRALLRRRQRIGKRRDDARMQPPLGGAAASGAGAHMGAQQCKRELARQQFVVSEPRPGRAFRRDIARAVPGGGWCAARR